jgi:hydrogenase-4 component E
MMSLLNLLLGVVLILNLFALGSSRISAVIRTVAIQGWLLGVMPLLGHGDPSLSMILMCIVATLLKGIAIPVMLMRALRDAQIKREMEPLIGYLPSIVLGAVATGLALILTSLLPLAPEHAQSLLVPASMATVLVGFILLITRYKAVTQLIGYLVLENGIFLFGLLLLKAMPVLVEMGVLLDLFVGVFVICIIVNHINRAFSSLDTRRLVELRE